MCQDGQTGGDMGQGPNPVTTSSGPSGLPVFRPPPCHTKERGDLAVLPTLQSLAHDLPKFITTLLFILLKILQGISKFSTRIHPNNLYIHMLTSGPGCVLITGLTHKNKSPRIKKNACLDYHTSKHTDVDEIQGSSYV